MEYDGFNIEIKDGLWISDIGSFYTFNEIEYSGDEGTYKTPYGIIHFYSGTDKSYQTFLEYSKYMDNRFKILGLCKLGHLAVYALKRLGYIEDFTKIL